MQQPEKDLGKRGKITSGTGERKVDSRPSISASHILSSRIDFSKKKWQETREKSFLQYSIHNWLLIDC